MRRYVPPGGSTGRSTYWPMLMAVFPLVGRLASLYADRPGAEGGFRMAGVQHGPIVVDQLVADRCPRATLHRFPGGRAILLALDVIGRELGHRRRDRATVARRHEVSGPARRDQVEGAAGRRRDHGQAAGHRLLHRLAERLERSRVDE